MFAEQAVVLSEGGHSISVVDIEQLQSQAARIVPLLDAHGLVVYRGWMLSPGAYGYFVEAVQQQGASAFTSAKQYLATHYLSNWYPLISDLTPETVILEKDQDFVSALRDIGWPRFFVKDYAKSLKTALGSVVVRPEDICAVVAEMEKFRGAIEGGLCVRRVENFVPNSEVRYFVLNGKPDGPSLEEPVPGIVAQCASRIDSPFFTVDVALREDGVLRVVELGDGQVSDLVGWSTDRFVSLWRAAN